MLISYEMVPILCEMELTFMGVQQKHKGNTLDGLSCITQFDVMKNWGWDIIHRQGGALTGPQKWNPLNIISILKWILTENHQKNYLL